MSCGVFLIEFVVFGIGGLLPAISTGAGFTPEDWYTLLSILGACSCVGRLGMGFIGDRFGALNSMMAVIVLTIVFMANIFIPFSTTSAPLLYTFSALWGYCSGPFYALSPGKLTVDDFLKSANMDQFAQVKHASLRTMRDTTVRSRVVQLFIPILTSRQDIPTFRSASHSCWPTLSVALCWRSWALSHWHAFILLLSLLQESLLLWPGVC